MFEDYAVSKEYRNKEEWHNLRGLGIGGSDCSIILDENPWNDKNTLWKIKKGLIEKEDISDNLAVKKGTLMEKPLRDIYQIANMDNMKVSEINETYFSLKYPYMLANLDGIIEITEDITKYEQIKDSLGNIEEYNHLLKKGELIGLEIKTAKAQSIKKWEEIPIYYYLQLQHYMIVTGLKKFILFARIETPYTTYEKEYLILADEEDQRIIIEKEKEFYESLQRDEEPTKIIKIRI
ncbi:YqaJ viral recombinase family protein [Streptobacillus moniliformis]|uniref:YqaJ viral recombinase family protein n=1 Tax=Streptobacillus moniliformis TaxID=34105 RepID=UPI0007E3B26D|nr:YqaJ viral recombinase family protein [Streptobacillus moniliformis]